MIERRVKRVLLLPGVPPAIADAAQHAAPRSVARLRTAIMSQPRSSASRFARAPARSDEREPDFHAYAARCASCRKLPNAPRLRSVRDALDPTRVCVPFHVPYCTKRPVETRDEVHGVTVGHAAEETARRRARNFRRRIDVHRAASVTPA